MSPRQLPALDATTAFRLVVLLEQYEQDVEELTSTWLDAALHARVYARLRDIRLTCAGRPSLSVPWVQLLLAQSELMHCMWTGPADGEACRVAERCKAAHRVAVRALRESCLQLLTETESAPRI